MEIATRKIASDFLENLLDGNRTNCSALAKQYFASNPSIVDLYEDILKDALYRVGLLWENNQISVATEHMATAIAEKILNEFFEKIISKERCNKKVVVCCVENEEHQVGIKMVADVFEMNGWDSYFLGTGIPVNELIRFIHQVKPDRVAISLSVYFNYTGLLSLLHAFKTEFPSLQVIVGGQAFQDRSKKIMPEMGNVILLTDLYLLEKYIQQLNTIR